MCVIINLLMKTSIINDIVLLFWVCNVSWHLSPIIVAFDRYYICY